MLKARERDKNVQNLYSVCESAYGILTDQLVSANSAFKVGDFRNMVFYIEKCDGFVSDCERVIGSQVARLNEMNSAFCGWDPEWRPLSLYVISTHICPFVEYKYIDFILNNVIVHACSHRLLNVDSIYSWV